MIACVVARLQREDRALDLGDALDDARAAALARRRAVEADRAGEAVARCCGHPRRAAAEAEADAEDRRHAEVAQLLDRRARVGLHAVVGRLLDVRHVLEVVVALRHAGGAAEVVERDRGVPALGEPQRELFVEVVEAAHVREDHDAGGRRVFGRREERRELVAVGRRQHEVVVRDGRAGDPRDRRLGVEVEAHGCLTLLRLANL